MHSQTCGPPWWLSSKESACSAGDVGVTSSIAGLGRSPGRGNGNPLKYSCWENPMDRRATVHGVTKSQTQLKWGNTHIAIQPCTLNSVEFNSYKPKLCMDLLFIRMDSLIAHHLLFLHTCWIVCKAATIRSQVLAHYVVKYLILTDTAYLSKEVVFCLNPLH